jgi:hypothetical protein
LDLKPNKITVCGGGNGAQTLVPIASHNLGCPVDIYAPFADETEQLAAGIAEHGGIEVTGAVKAKARPRRVSADPAEVIPGSSLVFLVLPAFAHESTLQQIVPHVDEGAWVGAIPARGGFDFCADRVLRTHERGDINLFGLQTLPWACRILKYGREVQILGVKAAVDAATRPAAGIKSIKHILERTLGLTIGEASSLMALTLANTGQLIHPGIMYDLFRDWDGLPFLAEEVPLFYHSLSDRGAQTLSSMSDEIQSIREHLEPALELSAVRPLKDWLFRSYASAIADPSTLRRAFVTNQAYAGLQAPMRKISEGLFVPDLKARYLSEDVPFGLASSQAIAGIAGLETPVMERVIHWANECLGFDVLDQSNREARLPQKYGLNNLEQLIAFALEN